MRLGEVEGLGPCVSSRKTSVAEHPRGSAGVLPGCNLGEGIKMARTEGFGGSTAIGAADDTRRRFKSSILGGLLVGLGNNHGLLMRLGRRWRNGDIA